MKTMKIIYMIKFLIYTFIVLYDCSINSKYTLAWALMAILMLVFYLEIVIEENINKLK